MTGGELRGVIRGLGKVNYRGDVAAQLVDVEGLGSVRRK